MRTQTSTVNQEAMVHSAMRRASGTTVAARFATNQPVSGQSQRVAGMAVREGCLPVTADERLVNALTSTPLASSLVLAQTL